jgi:hypothetical protein
MAAVVFEASVVVPILILLGALLFYSIITFVDALLHILRSTIVITLALNHLTPNGHFSGRTAPLTYRCCIFLFIQQIYVLNILNMLHTLRFSSSKCRLFHNAAFFGSCIIHILYTGCAKI